jgi:transcriptional regulator with XRE-family HTH domain
MKERIEQILEDKRITQAEFAGRAGISPATITHLFNGRNNLSEMVVSKILLAYPEINPIWLLEGRGEKYQKINEPLPLFVQKQEKEEEKQGLNLFPFNAQNGVENADIQSRVGESNQIISPVESVAASTPTAAQAVSQAANTQKQIRKVVFFYADKTFEEYYPESC